MSEADELSDPSLAEKTCRGDFVSLSEAAPDIVRWIEARNSARLSDGASDQPVPRLADTEASSDSGLASIPASSKDVPFTIEAPMPETVSQQRNAATGVVKVWEIPEPPARPHVLEGLVPDGAVTTLYGDGGVGKSYLALWIASCVCAGMPVFGRNVEKRTVLYIDAELDAAEFARRAYKVARGLGLERPPEGLHYWQLRAPLHRRRTLDEARSVAQSCGASFIVLDSLTVACDGMDPKEAPEVIHLFKGLNGLGTVLATDHIRHPQEGTSPGSYRPFGSAFKHHLGRSLIQVTKAPGGALCLRQTKANFDAASEPIGVALEFSDDEVKVSNLEASDERLAGIEEHLSPLEQVMHVLSRCSDRTATPEEIAQQLNVSEKTIRNRLSSLKQKGKLTNVGDGRWKLLQAANATT